MGTRILMFIEATNRVFIIATRLPFFFPPPEGTLSLDSHRRLSGRIAVSFAVRARTRHAAQAEAPRRVPRAWVRVSRAASDAPHTAVARYGFISLGYTAVYI